MQFNFATDHLSLHFPQNLRFIKFLLESPIQNLLSHDLAPLVYKLKKKKQHKSKLQPEKDDK